MSAAGQGFVPCETTNAHPYAITSMSLAPSRNTVATASCDKTIKIWDVSGRVPKVKVILKGHTEKSPECTCNHRGGGFRSNYVPNPLCRVAGHKGWVTAVDFSKNGRFLASGSKDCSIILWDTSTDTTERKVILEGHTEDNQECQCQHDGGFLGMDYKRSPLCPLPGHEGPVSSVAFSYDNKTLASASEDGTVILWDVSGETPEKKKTLMGHNKRNQECTCTHPREWHLQYVANPECPVTGHSGAVRDVVFSPNSETLAVVPYDGTVILWDVSGDTWKEKCTLRGQPKKVRCVAFSPDGGTLATGADSGHFWLWAVSGKEGKLIVTFNVFDSVRCMVFLTDKILAYGSRKGFVKVVDASEEPKNEGITTGGSRVSEKPNTTDITTGNSKSLPASKNLCPQIWAIILQTLSSEKWGICIRVCKAWKTDLEDYGLDYGFATLCSSLIKNGVVGVLNALYKNAPAQKIPRDLGRLDQVRRFLERHRFDTITSLEYCVQLALAQPEKGWLCCEAKKMVKVMGMMVQVPEQQPCSSFFRVLFVLGMHKERVNCLVSSNDGQLVSCSNDGQMKTWNIKEFLNLN